MKPAYRIVLSLAAATALSLSVRAADVIFTKDGKHSGDIVRVEPDGVTIKEAMGEVKVYKADIISLQVDKPAAVDVGLTALTDRKSKEAVAALKPVIDRLGGLDLDWVQDAMIALGRAHVAAGELANGKLVFDHFKAFYPTSPKVASIDAAYARILVEQKKYPEALAAVDKMLKPLLAKPSILDAEEEGAAQALLLQGDCQRELGKTQEALDSYLMITTLFDVDAALSAEAQYKAAGQFEQLKKWKRARELYKQVTQGPVAPLVEDAKKKLAALNEAHPE